MELTYDIGPDHVKLVFYSLLVNCSFFMLYLSGVHQNGQTGGTSINESKYIETKVHKVPLDMLYSVCY